MDGLDLSRIISKIQREDSLFTKKATRNNNEFITYHDAE
jgi:hypothetical protein